MPVFTLYYRAFYLNGRIDNYFYIRSLLTESLQE